MSIADELEALDKSYLTALEVAEAVGVTRETVYYWHRKGLIPGGFKIAGTLRFDKEAVVNHIREQQGAGS